MAEKYRRVEKTAGELPPNEIRVRAGVGIGRYLGRAHELFTSGKHDTIVIKGMQ